MSKFEFIALNAKRVKVTEGIYKGFVATRITDSESNTKALIPASSKQPRIGKKFYTLNCFKYKLNWIK